MSPQPTVEEYVLEDFSLTIAVVIAGVDMPWMSAATNKRDKLGLDEDEWKGIQPGKLEGEGDTEEAVIHEEEQYSPFATSDSVERLDDEVNEVLRNSKFL
jgi:hypothetical protein